MSAAVEHPAEDPLDELERETETIRAIRGLLRPLAPLSRRRVVAVVYSAVVDATVALPSGLEVPPIDNTISQSQHARRPRRASGAGRQ